MPTWRERPVVATAGAIVLLVVQLGGAALLLAPAPATGVLGPRVPSTVPDLLGSVELYGDDRIVVTGAQGLQEVRIGPETVLTTTTRAARPADIRPGKGVVAWGTDPARVLLLPEARE